MHALGLDKGHVQLRLASALTGLVLSRDVISTDIQLSTLQLRYFETPNYA